MTHWLYHSTEAGDQCRAALTSMLPSSLALLILSSFSSRKNCISALLELVWHSSSASDSIRTASAFNSATASVCVCVYVCVCVCVCVCVLLQMQHFGYYRVLKNTLQHACLYKHMTQVLSRCAHCSHPNILLFKLTMGKHVVNIQTKVRWHKLTL